MPAPVPIQIRYDDAGVLGAAAAASGRGQAFNAQRAMDMQLISQMLQNKVHASLQEDQQAHEEQMSNDAFAMQRAAQSQVPQQNYFNMADVASDPSASMKQMSLETAKAAGVEGPELATLETAVTNKHINAAYFESMADEMKKRAATAAGKKKNVAEKQAYFNSLGNALPAADLADLKSLSESEDINLPQFRTAVTEAKNRAVAAANHEDAMKKTVIALGVRSFDDKINQAQTELNSYAKDLKDMNHDPNDAPATYNPIVDPGSAAGRVLSGVNIAGFDMGKVADFYGGKPGVHGGDPMGLKTRLSYERKKREITNLQAQRADLVAQLDGGVGGSPAIVGPTPDSAKYHVGQEITVAGKKYRITRFDANGNAMTEEI